MKIVPEYRLDPGFIGGNYFDKYRSINPIHQTMMRGFLSSARSLLNRIEFESVLEVGCGPGDLAARIVPPQVIYLGMDIEAQQIEIASQRYPHLSFAIGSVYDLPLESKSYDLIIACEVLEHLEDPLQGLSEIARVAKKWVLISVPWEPTWRILNLLRCKYWSRFGNTPGHFQNFSRRSIRRLIEPNFEIQNEMYPIPWTMFLVRVR
jgi:ubiquinone/menaquinone biosynthesis C-methylase UbiE